MTKNNNKDKAEDGNDDDQALDALASEGSNGLGIFTRVKSKAVSKDSL